MIYVLVALFLFAVSFTTLGARRTRARLYWPIFAFLFIFACFRYQVGCDWSGYFFQYEAAGLVWQGQDSRFNDPLWWLVMSRTKAAGLYYPMVNVIAGGIFFAGVHMLARRQPDPLAFLVLLFPILIVNIPMSGIRQAAAIGVICLAFVAFIDRRPLRYALWVLLAGGFHTSAFVFIFLAPVASGNYSRWRLVAAGVLAVPGLLLLATGYNAGVAASRYIGGNIDAFGAVFRVGAIALSGLYFRLFLRRKWERDYPQDFALVNTGTLGMGFALLLLAVSSVIADRYTYYLIPIQAMIFARLPFFTFSRYKWQHVALPYLALTVMFVGWTQTSWLFDRCYMPYQTWVFGAPAGDILKEGLPQ